MLTSTSSPTVALRRLEWDSLHFGVPVAELPSPDLNDEDLRNVLTTARAEGLHLVYWAAHRERTLPADLLVEFHGLAVNHRVKFVAHLNDLLQNQTLASGAASAPRFAAGLATTGQNATTGQSATTGGLTPPRSPSLSSARSASYRIGEFPRGPASRELLQLSIVAGGNSRFQVDPRIPADKFRELYEVWMNRSTLRELADVVLVATPTDASDDFVGVITLSATEGAGQIGLLAVREDHRGQGVATLLMAAAHDWLRRQDVAQTSVVTQLENLAACGLYSRWNYEIVEVRKWFHFWCQDARDVE